MNYRFKNQVSRFLSHTCNLHNVLSSPSYGCTHLETNIHIVKENPRTKPETFISLVSCSLVFASHCPPISLVFALSKRTVRGTGIDGRFVCSSEKSLSGSYLLLEKIFHQSVPAARPATWFRRKWIGVISGQEIHSDFLWTEGVPKMCHFDLTSKSVTHCVLGSARVQHKVCVYLLYVNYVYFWIEVFQRGQQAVEDWKRAWILETTG